LDLSWCDDLSDVSALGGVHILNSEGCVSVVDFGALGHVHTLNIRECENVTDFSISALRCAHIIALIVCVIFTYLHTYVCNVANT
jgi:hypothetical protein